MRKKALRPLLLLLRLIRLRAAFVICFRNRKTKCDDFGPIFGYVFFCAAKPNCASSAEREGAKTGEPKRKENERRRKNGPKQTLLAKLYTLRFYSIK